LKATEAKLLGFLKKSPQFIIPIYQRTYSWTEPECQQLWDDILRTGRNEEISAHFVGSIVYIEEGLFQVTTQSPLLVIDGQQRLTTVSLIIEALARHIGSREPLDGFSAQKLRAYYLHNSLEHGELKYKLLLTQTDKQSLFSLVDQKQLPAEFSERLKANFEFFEDKIELLENDLVILCKGLAKLVIVDVSLNRDQDNPQLIFESMNSTGRELSQADLIRNFILMGLDPDHQTRLYNDHWRPMEIAFGQEAYGKQFDSFMRHYLTVKTGEIPNVRRVYKAFKALTRSPKVTDIGVDALLKDIHDFADYYSAMALDNETDKLLAIAFKDLRELKVEVAYPFLLELYDDYANHKLSNTDFVEIVRLIETYVFRRSVSAMPANSFNKTFTTFCRAINKEHYLESVKAHFLLMRSYRRFPNNEEFCREIVNRDMYNFRNRSYWLRKLENHERKEWVAVGEYTIEHILPQNENLSESWKESLGPDWQRIRETWLHTLGNLTLTGYNSEYSDLPFTKKRDMKGGFKESPLRVNAGLGNLDTWNEQTIQKRAENIATKAAGVWQMPSLPSEILNTYSSKEKGRAKYTIDDQKNLAEGSSLRALFEMFRKEVLALDPCVDEDFLKRYVAYKAESNFVDVVPLKSRLRLSLNMHFHDIQDPHQICKDITNVGRWGNGDVEVPLYSTDELPYIMGLVRQAFEKQMGNGEHDL